MSDVRQLWHEYHVVQVPPPQIRGPGVWAIVGAPAAPSIFSAPKPAWGNAGSDRTQTSFRFPRKSQNPAPQHRQQAEPLLTGTSRKKLLQGGGRGKKVSKKWRFGPLIRRRCGPRIWLFRWRCFFLTAGQEESQSQEEKQQNTACFST